MVIDGHGVCLIHGILENVVLSFLPLVRYEIPRLNLIVFMV